MTNLAQPTPHARQYFTNEVRPYVITRQRSKRGLPLHPGEILVTSPNTSHARWHHRCRFRSLFRVEGCIRAEREQR